MKVIKTNIEGVIVLEPRVHGDERGYFFESYNKESLPKELKNVDFVQDNESKSKKYTLRGLHYQLPPMAQAKLVRVVKGEVLDVIVDIRPKSPTYGESLSILLNEISKKMLFVPKGFAHGYITLSDEAIFAYKCDNYYSPNHEAGINALDKKLKVDWILPEDKCIMSEKDRILPDFSNHLVYEG